MSEMVERVAQELHRADWRGNVHTWNECPVQDKFRASARAAIRALREPTEEMIKAAGATAKMRAIDGALQLAQLHGWKFEWGDWNDSPIYDAFQAAIDAALDEPEQKEGAESGSSRARTQR